MSWIEHVKNYAKENNVPYSQALKQAKDSYIKGGSLASKDLKNILSSTYENKNQNVGEFKVDESLSGKRAKVYHNNETGQTVVAHRGTKGAKDWMTDGAMALGYEGGNRFKHAEKVQKKAEAKYGTENLTTVGHSLGARLAEKYGQNGQEVITLNKPIIPKTFGKTISKNQYDIRSTTDAVSGLADLQKNKNLTEIKTKTANPLLEHKTNILNRKSDKIFGKVDNIYKPSGPIQMKPEQSIEPVIDGAGFRARKMGAGMIMSKLEQELMKRKK